MQFDLTGKTALVTGASSGLGRHFAQRLAQSGAAVIAAARRVDRVQALAAEAAQAGLTMRALALDVTDPASIEACLAAAGPIDVLVNNAGIAVDKPALETTTQEWDDVIATNLSGAWYMAQAVAKNMVAAKRGGSIVNIASILGLRVATRLPAYIAAKAGLVNLTQALALEWARHGIRVNAIAPGYVVTDMNRAFFESEAGQIAIKRIPQRRIGKPEDLDGVLLLLASDASAYMTGSIVAVDGGHAVNSL